MFGNWILYAILYWQYYILEIQLYIGNTIYAILYAIHIGNWILSATCCMCCLLIMGKKEEESLQTERCTAADVHLLTLLALM